MGLDAFVNCNCYKEGKTKPFPIPEFERFFGVNQDGHMSISFDWERYYDHETVLKWMENACEHLNMQIIFTDIGDGRSHMALKKALLYCSVNALPTLHSALLKLPDTRRQLSRYLAYEDIAMGCVSVYSAAKILKEIAWFRENYKVTIPVLIDSASRTMLTEGIPNSTNWFIYRTDENTGMGFDTTGIYVVESGSEVFRSMRCSQKVLEEWENDVPKKVEFYDLETARLFTFNTEAIIKGTWIIPDFGIRSRSFLSFSEFPELIHVEHRTLIASDHEYVLNALETVCKASVETGNPVVWC